MERRHFLKTVSSYCAAGALSACATSRNSPSNMLAAPSLLPHDLRTLKAINAQPERIIATNICTRPFRAQGPRLERTKINGKELIHSYGHGGSGWSLSWGNAVPLLDQSLSCK